MSLKPKVALSQDFLMQMTRLPQNVQAKVMKWAIQFQIDPTSPGINYEKINAARDANLKSVRLDRDWRGIVFKPDRGDVYVLMYVDHHDDAYRWAENRKLAINPVTGAMQLMVLPVSVAPPDEGPEVRTYTAKIDASATTAAAGATSAPLYAAVEDHDLMALGVPEAMLTEIRRIASEADLDAMQARLPVEAYEGLYLVAAGDSVDQVLSNRETRVDRTIDPEDFAAALATPEAQSRFVVVADDQELQAILNAPLNQWRVFLHPTQRKLAEGDRSGPVRVLGGAGTGKTVLAMHRARWLAANRCPSDRKVLLTTFTRNLAVDIEANLRTLCPAELLKRITVQNLDGWVQGYLRSQKLEHRIVYDRKDDPARQAWRIALGQASSTVGLPESFYEAELEEVVLAQGVTTLEGYRKVRRTGRRDTLSRGMRDAIWPVFEEYRGQLATRRLKEVSDAYREIAEMLEQQDARAGFDSIIVDETQDLGPQALRLLRAMVAPGSNDLFFVGDGHQRIYGRHRAAMSKCGIDIRGRSRKLYLNYRTTDEIRRLAVAQLEGCKVDDLDDGIDEVKKYKSLTHGPAPEVIDAAGMETASHQVLAFIKSVRDSSVEAQHSQPTICVVAASAATRDAIGRVLESQRCRTAVVTAQGQSAEGSDVVHLSTMHRAKGLEFDAVAVVAPAKFFGNTEETINDRKLVYVALTRAKRDALLLRVQ